MSAVQPQDLQQKLGYTFQNSQLLLTALTHTSFANEDRHHTRHNERLEFLGDSVLSVVVSEYLFSHNRQLPEGQLTRIRASLVCENSLFQFAQQLGLGAYLRLGRGEEKNGGRTRPAILADAFEAVIAAIYLDGGLEAARQFILPYVRAAHDTQKDYKTRLQEVVQQNPEERVRYEVVSQTGPDHDKNFTVEVHLNSNCIGRGSGHSKKAAEQAAAREALALLGLSEPPAAAYQQKRTD